MAQMTKEERNRINLKLATKDESRCYVFSSLVGKVTIELISMAIRPVLKEVYDDWNKSSSKRDVYKGIKLNYENLASKTPEVKDPVQFTKLLLQKGDMPNARFENLNDIYHKPDVVLALILALIKTGDVKDDKQQTYRLTELLQQNTKSSQWTETIFNEGVQAIEAMLDNLQLEKIGNASSSFHAIQERFNGAIHQSRTLVQKKKNNGLVYSAPFASFSDLQNAIEELKVVYEHDEQKSAIADEIRSFLNGFQTEVYGRLDKLDGRADKLDGRADKVDGRVDRVEDSVNSLSYDVKQLNLEKEKSSTTEDANTNETVHLGGAAACEAQGNIAETVLRHIAEKLASSWYNLGIHLGIDSSKLDTIRDAKSYNHCAWEMLKIWRSKTTSLQQRVILIDALGKTGRQDLSDEMRKLLKEGEAIDEIQLINLSKKLGDKWEALGTYLGVKSVERKAIKNVSKENPLNECAFNMLEMWQNQFQGSAVERKKHLCDKLKVISRVDIADWLKNVDK